MPQHEEKTCPRCKKSFECKCGSINLCQCSAISLSDHLSQQLKKDYPDCLCIQCLREIKQTNIVGITRISPENIRQLIMNR
ncbi:MAG: cysteine-rich CWC family protein [Gammaproteobacteria bacterium]|nr:cysteine-rich CWC family protein [Gammaproteobacteria bacterium]MCW8909085.1 cysteine-rich CWC family protein [Gammaproteobacteria bacterium]MCW9055638.1 cysteine-rich CWC family protein [Gammaproteobacteria bacterium]